MRSGVAELLQQLQQSLQSGDLHEARNRCEEILDLEPENPAAHLQSGVIAFRLGAHDEAIARISRAIEIDPGQWAFHGALGDVYGGLGNWPAATACYRRALELNRRNPEMHNKLGETLVRRRDLAAAAKSFRAVLAIEPDSPNVQHNLAVTLHQSGRDREAAEVFRKLAAGRPGFPDVHYNLGVALAGLEEFDAAIASYREAIRRRPDSAVTHNNLGTLLTGLNEPDAAIACYRDALRHQPDHAQARSNLLMTMNYQAHLSQHDLYAESLQFETCHALAVSGVDPVFANSREPERRLRVGYVSADFRTHSVAHFTRRLIGAHDRNAFEVFCYSNVIRPDDLTGQFRAQADHWCSTVELDDEALAERIRSDGIDILVDLAGHTSNNRLLVFARKPAPVQVNWLGYPNTTGMRAMDYRLTDAVADPPGEADRLHSEKLVRLDHGFLCYQADDATPDVTDPPCLRQGHITFGSFNNFPKLGPDVVRVWSRILDLTPGSRLVLKSRALLDEKTRQRCAGWFGAHGVSPDRLDLLATVPTATEHLAAYARIDVGLDPFPYNGTTTTCEALWMGVPVVCLRGERHAGRVGASILQRVGLAELVAEDVDFYVELARELAGDAGRLSSLRAGLRERMRRSPLMDVAGFTETLERAYQDMWRAWCESVSTP